MKNCIKKIAVLSLMIVLAISIVSCGSEADSPYVGIWKATVATMEGVEVDVTEVLGEYTMEIKANGEITMTLGEEIGTAEWETTQNGITVTDGNQQMHFVTEDDKLTVESEGVMIYFEKE